MSGRSLRRLPVLAHARYMGSLSMLGSPSVTDLSRYGKDNSSGTDVAVWLDAIERVVESQATERERLQK